MYVHFYGERVHCFLQIPKGFIILKGENHCSTDCSLLLLEVPLCVCVFKKLVIYHLCSCENKILICFLNQLLRNFLLLLCFLCLQDSAAVQILLEICLPTEEEKANGVNPDSLLRNVQSVITTNTPNKGMEEGEDNLLCNLREVQCLICCLLHQMYIADPNIAKLVHFQVCFQRMMLCV